MPSKQEQFSHFYHDCLRDLELEKSKNETEMKSVESQEQISYTLFLAFNSLLDEVLKKLKIEKPEPELILKNGLKAINKIEDFRFILENLLEGIKRDGSLQNMLIDFNKLELYDWDVKVSTYEKKDTKKSPWQSNYKSGKAINRLLNRLKKVALTVMEIVANAIKVIPKLIAIKPKPSIGLSGPFPTFSIEFELEAESMTIHELFHELKCTLDEGT